MATQLDLEEQEQLDRLKAFWARWGNLVTGLLVVVAAGWAAVVGWDAWQRDQGAKAGAMYDELEVAARSGDAMLTGRIFADIRDRYPRTAFAAQGGLLAAKVAVDKEQRDAARADLGWVAESGADPVYRDIARLRLAGLLLDAKAHDDALRQLDAVQAPEFVALASDRRGDVLAALGKADEAKTAWRKAWDGLDAKTDYRRVVEAKLDAAGAAPAPVAATAPAAPVASAAPAPVAPPPASGASR